MNYAPQVIDMVLPEHCFNRQNRFVPDAAMMHFISIDVGNKYLADNLAEWMRFDAAQIWAFFAEMNLPMNQWGSAYNKIWKPVNSTKRGYGSYHRVIDREGIEYRFVPDDVYAYHAGETLWNGRENCNSFCLGYALINDGKSPYTDAQYETLTASLHRQGLGANAITRHDVARSNWLAVHAGEERATKVPRKPDPGLHYDEARVRTSLNHRWGSGSWA